MKKFNLFDVLIILVVILACFLGYKFLSVKSETTGNVPEISYVVEIRRQDDFYMDLVKEGDEIKDAIKGGHLGTVTDFKWQPSTEVVDARDTGEYVKKEIPGKYDYYITLTGIPTTYSDSKILFASQEVRVGEIVYLRSKNYSGYGCVVDMKLPD